MTKKFTTIILSSLLVTLLGMPMVSAWATSASTSLLYGESYSTSGEVGLSKKARFSATNTSAQNYIDVDCYAAYYTSLYTNEYEFSLPKGKTKSYDEPQDIISKYKIRLCTSGACKETGNGTVKIL